jgi:hypothetical protein
MGISDGASLPLQISALGRQDLTNRSLPIRRGGLTPPAPLPKSLRIGLATVMRRSAQSTPQNLKPC